MDRFSNVRALRLGAYGVACGLLGSTLVAWLGRREAWERTSLPLFLGAAALGVGGAWLSRSARGARPLARGIRVVELVGWNLLLVLVLAELGACAMQRLAPSQLLWDSTDAASTVVAMRGCTTRSEFRSACNSEGYVDDEFVEPNSDDYVVALIADSFGVGRVPYEFNFATLAERVLREGLGTRYERVAIDNRGISAIDLPEYRVVFETEVAGRPYRQVVLCLFVGNDIPAGRLPGERSWRDRLRLQGWLAPKVAQRVWLIARDTERNARPPAPDGLPAFLRNASLEPPFMTPDAFVKVERERMMYTLAGERSLELVYRQAMASLRRFQEALGSRLLIVLIPDEYQVNDAVWDAALASAAAYYHRPPEAFVRDYPQRRVARWASNRGVRVLDLLPALREAEKQGHTYHLRDTHWNAHGNRVAGRELGRALLAYAEGEGSP